METPRKMKFEEHRDIASDIGEESGDFYFVTAECIQLKFSAKRTGSTNSSNPPPSRSPVASPSGSHGHFWKRHKDYV